MHVAICHHLSLSYGGGGERFVSVLAQYLKEGGHDVSIFSLPYNPLGSPRCVPILPSGVSYRETLSADIRADVAYVMYAPLMRVPFKLNCPAIAGIHSDVFLSARPNLRYGIVPRLAHILHSVLGKRDLSRYHAVRLPCETKNFPHRNVFVIPGPVNGHIFRPQRAKRNRFTVAYVGRPLYQKGWDLFQSIAGKASRVMDVDFIALGGGRSTINIQGLGYIADQGSLADMYSQVHLVVSPSRADTFGRSSVESLMCGTPVLTTPLLSHRRLNLPFLYADSPNAFVDNIASVYSMWKKERERYLGLRMKCVEAARQYDQNEVMPRWMWMLREVAASNVE